MIYFTYAEALKRVEQLKKLGIWPGIITDRHGRCRLTFDPREITVGDLT